ncbi:uncharacterized protein LOC62_02G001996 [Vanrija pseudolonga]|uniref:Uncharacterized protein n=1 Tax=Vanrija pseudolonga TaxID=143232 RepID=A0AAF1BJK1_9TREE|nr:hypothetical protein LOC62_02G001996 [Vanrija pseudolonga]
MAYKEALNRQAHPHSRELPAFNDAGMLMTRYHSETIEAWYWIYVNNSRGLLRLAGARPPEPPVYVLFLFAWNEHRCVQHNEQVTTEWLTSPVPTIGRWRTVPFAGWPQLLMLAHAWHSCADKAAFWKKYIITDGAFSIWMPRSFAEEEALKRRPIDKKEEAKLSDLELEERKPRPYKLSDVLPAFDRQGNLSTLDKWDKVQARIWWYPGPLGNWEPHTWVTIYTDSSEEYCLLQNLSKELRDANNNHNDPPDVHQGTHLYGNGFQYQPIDSDEEKAAKDKAAKDKAAKDKVAKDKKAKEKKAKDKKSKDTKAKDKKDDDKKDDDTKNKPAEPPGPRYSTRTNNEADYVQPKMEDGFVQVPFES